MRILLIAASEAQWKGNFIIFRFLHETCQEIRQENISHLTSNMYNTILASKTSRACVVSPCV